MIKELKIITWTALLVGSVFSKGIDLSSTSFCMRGPTHLVTKEIYEMLLLLPPSLPLLCHHCVLMLEINQGPLLRKGFLFERNRTGHSLCLPSSLCLARPCSPKLPRQRPRTLGEAARSHRPVFARQLLFEPSSDRKIKSGSEGSGKHCAMSLLKAADASFGVTCCGWWVWMMWGFR